MNKLIAVFLLFSVNVLYGQSFQDNDLNLKGAVKTVHQLDFRAIEKDGEIVKGDTIACSELTYEFDNNSRLITEEYYCLDILTSLKYKYDQDGKLFERMNCEQLDRTYEYDSIGNQVKEEMFDSDGQFGYWTYKYDNNGNTIERAGYLGDDFVERWIYEYDQDNKKIKEFMVGEEPDNTPVYMIKTFEYDKKGRLIAVVWTDPGTKLTSVDKYKYNGKNDLIEHYNKNDFQRGIEELNTFKYQYDKKGNWIQRIEYSNSKPTIISERKINYN